LGWHLNFRFKLTRKILYQQTQMINWQDFETLNDNNLHCTTMKISNGMQ
jgi:hypothetical protein